MTFAQRRTRLTTHFSERIPVVKRRMTILRVGVTKLLLDWMCPGLTALSSVTMGCWSGSSSYNPPWRRRGVLDIQIYILAVDRGGWSSRPGRFTPRERGPVPIVQEAGLDVRRKSSPTPGFNPRTIQPAASLCTDWDIPAHKGKLVGSQNIGKCRRKCDGRCTVLSV